MFHQFSCSTCLLVTFPIVSLNLQWPRDFQRTAVNRWASPNITGYIRKGPAPKKQKNCIGSKKVFCGFSWLAVSAEVGQWDINTDEDAWD